MSPNTGYDITSSNGSRKTCSRMNYMLVIYNPCGSSNIARITM
jgi:hypothetical protein